MSAGPGDVLSGALLIRGRDTTAEIDVGRTLASVIPDAEPVLFEATRPVIMTRGPEASGDLAAIRADE